MKSGMWLYGVMGAAGLLGLAALTLLPVLYAIAPKGPTLVPVEGAALQRLGDGSVRYHEVGQGDAPLLLLHGFNNQLATWNAVLPYVRDCGRVVRIDIPGYGGSNWPAESYSVASQAARIIEFMDARGLDQVTLVGGSMGASLAAMIAARYPERVKALLILAPSGYPGSLRFGGRFAPLYRPGPMNTLVTRLASSGIFRWAFPNSKALHAFTVTASYDSTWAEVIRDIQAPTLILWSRGDPAIPYSYAAVVAGLIPGSVLVPLAPELGHSLLVARAELIGRMACALNAGVPPARIVDDLGELLIRNGDR